MNTPDLSIRNLMSLVSIETCLPEDYSNLRELHRATVSSVGWRFYSHAEIEAKLAEINEPGYTISLLNENVLLAKLNDSLVASSSWRPSVEHPQTAITTQLYLHPLFQDGAIATALIEESEQRAYNQGFRWMSALSDFNMRIFFTRLGYRNDGFKDGCKNLPAKYPLQIMKRHISTHYSHETGSRTNPERRHIHAPVVSD